MTGHSASDMDAPLPARREARAAKIAAQRVRVLVADDHPLTLDGIKAAIGADASVEIIAEANDGPTALRRAVELKPDVAVLDLSMPGFDGVELARRLLEACPDCRVLSLGLREDAPALRRLLDLGVAGYVLKSSDSAELGRCVRSIAHGGVYLDPAIAGVLVGRDRRVAAHRDQAEDLADLSKREVEVLRLSALGHSTKLIGAQLRIGPKSVETYKARAMAKLGFNGRVELVRFAASAGWLS